MTAQAMRPPLPAGRALVEGVACALGAGLLWGLVFVVPLMLPDYPPAMLSFGRYLGFGVIALLLAWADLPHLQQLRWPDWQRAFELALVGNILYYLFLSAAIQLADAPLPTMLIGTLPIVIAIVSNFGSEALPWRRLLPSLAVIAIGIVLVNSHEMALLGEVSARHTTTSWGLCWHWQRSRPGPGTRYAIPVGCANGQHWLPAPGPSPRAWRRCPWRLSAWRLPVFSFDRPTALTIRSGRTRCATSD
jgi:hypothetical protein